MIFFSRFRQDNRSAAPAFEDRHQPPQHLSRDILQGSKGVDSRKHSVFNCKYNIEIIKYTENTDN